MGGLFARGRSLLATTWAVVGLSLLALFAIDFALRALLPSERRDSRTEVDRHQADSFDGVDFIEPLLREFHDSKEMAWTPYLHWRRLPFEGEYIHVDREGRRKTWSAPGSEGATRVFFFGGSTAWGAGARDDFTIPSLLAKEMHEAGRVVEVSNFGESGYVSTQGVISLVLALQRGEIPDLVVFYDGANDLFAALQEARAGTPQNEDNRRSEFNLSRRRGRLAALTLRRTFVGIDRLATRLWGEGDARSGVSSELLAREVVDLYAQNLAIVEALAQRFGFDALYYWQPSVFSKRERTAFEDKLAASRSERERALFAAAVDRVATSSALAAVEGFRNLSDVFGDTRAPVFFDFIHVSESGNSILARAIASDLMSGPGQRSEEE